MSNKNTEAKAYLSGLPAVLVFATVCLLASLVIALTESEPHFDLVIPTVELENCDCCGFVPWTDSWCEFHYST
jgi:hypothetical protein